MSSRIQLELLGKYSETDAFKNFDEDVKKSQRNCKDFADVGKSVLGELSGEYCAVLEEVKSRMSPPSHDVGDNDGDACDDERNPENHPWNGQVPDTCI